MKTKLTRAGTLHTLIACVLFTAAGLPAADNADIQKLFDQGRAAFYQGDYVLAAKLLKQVQVAAPKHEMTRIMLATIATQPKEELGLKATYAAVKIPKIQLSEVTLDESLQALSVMAKNASGGKVTPNFIVKSPDLNKMPLTMSLTNAPLDEVVRYIAEMAKAKVTWDKHAVVFSGASDP
jgi:hypothetical protein